MNFDPLEKAALTFLAFFVVGVLLAAGEISYQDAAQQEQMNCTMYPRAFEYCKSVQIGRVER